MKLDKFDQAVLEELEKRTNPVDFMRTVYGIRLGNANAKKQKTGIRRHLEHKSALSSIEIPDTHKEERIVFGKDGSRIIERVIELTEEEKQNPQIIMQKMGLDFLQWELLSLELVLGSWEVTIKNEQNRGEKHTNYKYHCKIKVRPIIPSISTADIKTVFNSLSSKKSLSDYTYKPQENPVLVELPIMDVHVGKLSLEEETGNIYNLDIAIELFRKTILDFLNQINQFNIEVEKFYYPFGNDFFHIDTLNNTTTSGTKVDTDGKWKIIYEQGLEAFIWAIEQLRKIAPVEIVLVSGNHDEMLSTLAILSAQTYYKDIETVTFDCSASPRKWFNYGNNTVLFSHGRYDQKRILNVARNEIPLEILGKTIFLEIHLADVHHEEVKDIGGVLIRRIPSITAADKWHSDRGYTAVRRAQAFVWDKENGLISILQSNVRA